MNALKYYAASAGVTAWALVMAATVDSNRREASDPPPARKVARKASPRVTVRFSPRGGCTALVVWHLDAARHSAFVASYQWSSPEIHAAVLRARERKVRVRVLLDDAMESSDSSLLPGLLAAGMTPDEVRVDDRHAIFHNKVILRDAEVPALAAHENGSFNYSKSAESSNAENSQVVEGCPEVTAAYLADLEAHWAHARPAKVK